jgi:hypothetical protein
MKKVAKPTTLHGWENRKCIPNAVEPLDKNSYRDPGCRG